MTDPRQLVLDEAAEANWYAQVGRPVDLPFPVRQVSNWENANMTATDYWMDVLQAAQYQQNALIASSMTWDFLDESSRLASETRQRSRELAHRKTCEAGLEGVASRNIMLANASIILHTAVGAAFLGWPNKTLFCDLSKVIFGGHVPCGWDGEYPTGRFIIY